MIFKSFQNKTSETRTSEHKKGFTLIELLVSISIIAALVGVILVIINPNTLRAKTRDAQRVNDIKAIQSALELYLADTGTYPTCTGVWERIYSGSCIVSKLTPSSSTSYMKKVPADPSQVTDSNSSLNPCLPNTAEPYRYNYKSDGKQYILTAIMEVSSDANSNLCSGLSNWSAFSPTCGTPLATSTATCYGVKNPI